MRTFRPRSRSTYASSRVAASARTRTVNSLSGWVPNFPVMRSIEVARALQVEIRDVRIISTPIGGSFGSKSEGPFPIFLALLAKATGRPVRIVLTREEVMAVGAKRHPFRVHSRLGLNEEGAIVALDTDAVVDAGPYAGFTPAVLGVAAEASSGTYYMPNARFRGRAVYTNNSNGGAFRGYGLPQMTFPLESSSSRRRNGWGWTRRRSEARHASAG